MEIHFATTALLARKFYFILTLLLLTALLFFGFHLQFIQATTNELIKSKAQNSDELSRW